MDETDLVKGRVVTPPDPGGTTDLDLLEEGGLKASKSETKEKREGVGTLGGEGEVGGDARMGAGAGADS